MRSAGDAGRTTILPQENVDLRNPCSGKREPEENSDLLKPQSKRTQTNRGGTRRQPHANVARAHSRVSAHNSGVMNSEDLCEGSVRFRNAASSAFIGHPLW